MQELFRPFAYLTIKHNSKLPRLVNWVVPFCLSTFTILAINLFGLRVDMLGGSGATSKFLGFVQSLPGFYIAALAAISTFNNPDMLKLMPGNPPTMRIVSNGGIETVKLTRRRFLSSLFAYLTVASVLITIASIASLAIADPLKGIIDPHFYWMCKGIFSFIYLFAISQLLCITLWGLYYLGERIHTPG